MDDIKRITIQVAGQAYRFAPLDAEDVGRIQMFALMGVSGGKQTRAVFGLLKKSLGDDEWDEFADRAVSGEIDVAKEIPRITERLMKRFAKDAEPSDDEA